MQSMQKHHVKVTIDGLDVPCGGVFGGPSWTLSTGVTAPEIVWRLDPAAADQVLSKREVEIIFYYQDATLVIKRAVVVKETPTGSPFSRGVVLSDVRWYWQRMWVKRSFNVRMRTGSARLASGPDGIPTQTLNLIDEFAYAKFSLKNDTAAWNADEMIEELMKALVGKKGWDASVHSRKNIKPSDVEVDDRGDHALARALAAIGGGIDVRVDPDGTVVLFDRVLGSEKGMIESAFGAPLLGLGMIRWVDMSHVIPPRIVNLFTRDMELRLDYIEEASETERVDDVPSLDCVAQITDTTLKVNGADEVQGTWVKLTDLLSAFNSSPLPFPKPVNGFNPPQKLDTLVLQDRYLGPAMYLQYVTGFGAIPSQQWSARIGSVMKSYRLDFRINRKFLGRILPGSIRAVRVGLADAVTGMRQQSPVYMDYCERPTLRQLAINTEATLGWNSHCLTPRNADQNLGPSGAKAYPNSAKEPYKIKLKDCQPAPATLKITDAQVGIVSIEMRRDTWDQAEILIPSLVQNLPVVNPFKVATASALATWEQCSLAKNHRMITIVSVIPAGPNNEASLHPVEVSLETCLERLDRSKGWAGSAENASPIVQRIYPGLERARFVWSDEAADQILGAFAAKKGTPAKLRPVNEAVLKDIAETFSATLIATMLNHYEGAMAKEFDPSLVPIGSVHTVTHSVDGTGRALSTVNCEPRGPVIRPEALMSTATRRVLLGEGVSK